jgi:hypothetical protein
MDTNKIATNLYSGTPTYTYEDNPCRDLVKNHHDLNETKSLITKVSNNTMRGFGHTSGSDFLLSIHNPFNVNDQKQLKLDQSCEYDREIMHHVYNLHEQMKNHFMSS